jgi:hypothetical protein
LGLNPCRAQAFIKDEVDSCDVHKLISSAYWCVPVHASRSLVLSTYLGAATAALAVLQQLLYADTYVLRGACCNVTHCRAQAFIKDEVETYVPAGDDLAYPGKLEAAAAKAAAAAAAGEITEDAGEDADGAQVGCWD